jgi:microcystin-dependent protein
VQVVGDAPVGSLMAYAGSAIPSDWLTCDGRAVARLAYPDLFNAIGTSWGVGDGSTTFNLPDLRNRMLYGAGTRALGKLSTAAEGEEAHLLLTAEAAQKAIAATGNDTPDHTHAFPANGVARNVAGGAIQLPNGPLYSSWDLITATQGASARHTHPITGSDAATSHNNMPPYAIVNWIIRVFPPYKTANLAASIGGPFVTALPPYPTDNQVVYFLASDQGDGVASLMYCFRYRLTSGQTFKWECVGGVPMLNGTYFDEDTARGGSLSTVPTAMATLTVPLAGDYLYDWNATQNAQVSVTETHAALYKNGVVIANTRRSWSTGGYANDKVDRGRLIGLAKNDVITLNSWIDVGSSATGIWSRSLSLMPVRVG